MRTLICFICCICVSQAGELEECKAIAQKYQLLNEVVLSDGSRVDLLSEHFAIEVDWSEKWAEGIGQALFYGIETKKKPGVLLLRRQDESDASFQAHLRRCRIVCEIHNLFLWTAVEGNPSITKVYPQDPFSIEITQ